MAHACANAWWFAAFGFIFARAVAAAQEDTLGYLVSQSGIATTEGCLCTFGREYDVEDGNILVLKPCTVTYVNQFIFKTDGRLVLHDYPQKCVDASNLETGSELIIRKCTGAPSQVWSWEPLPNTSSHIIRSNAGLKDKCIMLREHLHLNNRNPFSEDSWMPGIRSSFNSVVSGDCLVESRRKYWMLKPDILSAQCNNWYGRLGKHWNGEPGLLAICMRWESIYPLSAFLSGIVFMCENVRQALTKGVRRRPDYLLLLACASSVYPIFYNHHMLIMYANIPDHRFRLFTWQLFFTVSDDLCLFLRFLEVLPEVRIVTHAYHLFFNVFIGRQPFKYFLFVFDDSVGLLYAYFRRLPMRALEAQLGASEIKTPARSSMRLCTFGFSVALLSCISVLLLTYANYQ